MNSELRSIAEDADEFLRQPGVKQVLDLWALGKNTDEIAREVGFFSDSGYAESTPSWERDRYWEAMRLLGFPATRPDEARVCGILQSARDYRRAIREAHRRG